MTWTQRCEHFQHIEIISPKSSNISPELCYMLQNQTRQITRVAVLNVLTHGKLPLIYMHVFNKYLFIAKEKE